MRLGVPVMASMIVTVAAGLAATPGGAQQSPGVCDADHDGTVTVKEARGCAGQRFDLARGGAPGLAEEQFTAALAAADALKRQFAQVDRDGDGRVSRDEWLQWFGPAYADDRELSRMD